MYSFQYTVSISKFLHIYISVQYIPSSRLAGHSECEFSNLIKTLKEISKGIPFYTTSSSE